ncbi:protein of unknown function [Desulfovibrio sp. 86]|nr:protein of unknown function [Desulfovibrio sp. 86]
MRPPLPGAGSGRLTIPGTPGSFLSSFMRNSFNSGVRKHLITQRRKTPRRTLSAPQDTHLRALTALLMLALLFRAVKIFSRLSGAETVAERWRTAAHCTRQQGGL